MPANPRKKHGHRYPWPEWFADLPRELRRGEDFHGCRAISMAQAAYQASKRLGLFLTIVVAEDGHSLTIKPGNRINRKGRPRCPG